MKKSIMVVALVLLVICSVGYFLINSRVDYSKKKLKSLMLNSEDFPTGWIFYDERPITGDYDWGIENNSKTFVIEPERGYAIEYVYKSRNILWAKYTYFFLKRQLSLIKESSNAPLWYQSEIADNWYSACVINDVSGVLCDLLGRYKNYIIYFSITTKKDVITTEEVTKIFEKNEKKVEAFLSKSEN